MWSGCRSTEVSDATSGGPKSSGRRGRWAVVEWWGWLVIPKKRPYQKSSFAEEKGLFGRRFVFFFVCGGLLVALTPSQAKWTPGSRILFNRTSLVGLLENLQRGYQDFDPTPCVSCFASRFVFCFLALPKPAFLFRTLVIAASFFSARLNEPKQLRSGRELEGDRTL